MSSSNSTTNEERYSKIYIVSKVFETVKQSCFLGSAPTKELFDMFTKLGSKSSDMQVRIACFKALKRVLKAGAQNAFNISAELLKTYTKILDKYLSASELKEHDIVIKEQCLKGLVHFVKKSMNMQLL